MKRIMLIAAALALLAIHPARAEMAFWGINVEKLEHRLRIGNGTDVFSWDAKAMVGTDELKFVLRTEAEFDANNSSFEALENQARLQKPISTFFDAVAGVRVDTPAGRDRIYGVLGVHGLAPQWFEVDADLYLSDRPAFRFEADYEALLTNRLILRPSVEFNLPLRDDRSIDAGAFGPKIEIGARLSYDLVDRTVAPYVGVHYERTFGESADILREEGKSRHGTFFVAGLKLMF
ncbi:MAG: copper resistance protein B [Proteobacteria bacterium]|nr:copper resistance protein B [Pseudomonadota bacterium]